jgi:monoamine oxidase
VAGTVRPAAALDGVFELLESAPVEPDASGLELSEALGLDAEAAHWFAQFIEGFHAAPLDRINASSILRQTRGGAQQRRIVGGYGRLVEYLHAELERLGATFVMRADVHRVEATGGGVSVFTRGHPTYRAGACIAALPLGVLRVSGGAGGAGGVEWEPRPAWLSALVGRFEMGGVWRVTVSLREPVAPWGDLPVGAFIHALDAPFPTWWSRPSRDEAQLVAWCGGPKTARFAGAAEAQEGALATLSTLTGKSPRELATLVSDVRAHDFINDPYVRGAYPYEVVGGEDGPDFGPVAGAPPLLFAGDYLDAEELGTVGAAVKSGTAAARVLLGARPAAA